jgi:DNA-binding IclR family transcriptional regulator
MEKSPVQSVRKALDLLDMVVAAELSGRPAALADLAEGMGMRPNSAWNLLRTLVDCGYLTQHGRGLYRLGPKLRQLGLLNRFEAPAVREALETCLRELAEQQREGVVLAVLVRGVRLVLARVDVARAVTVSHARVEESGFFAKPTGRMLAALAEPDQLAQILKHNGWPGADWDGIRSAEDLHEALAALRVAGVCTVVSADDELVALACPVAGSPPELPAVVGVYAPRYRCDGDRQTELLARLRETADRVGQTLAELWSAGTKELGPCH